MAKTRLSNCERETILLYMMDKLREQTDCESLEALASDYVTQMNIELRKKYPEKDMKILRKYDLTTRFTIYHVVNLETKQEVCTCIPAPAQARTVTSDAFVDIPRLRSAAKEIPVSQKTIKAYEAYLAAAEVLAETRRNKKRDYSNFLGSCHYAEDVEEIIPLPVDLRQRLGMTNFALIAVNPEKLKEIHNDFKEKEVNHDD